MRNIFMVMKYYKGTDKKRFPKFDKQIAALRRMSYNVSYIYFNNFNIYFHNGVDDILLKKNYFYYKKLGFINSIFEYYYLYKYSRSILEKSNSIDYIYMRYMPYSIGMKKLYKICGKFNFIVEMSTHPILNEVNMEKNKLKRIYFKLSISALHRYSKYVTIFTLIGKKQDSYFNRPSINISNGTDTIGVSKWTKEQNINKDVHLIGVANLAKWHGYDRLIAGMENYYKNQISDLDIFFHIVGRDGDGSLVELKKYINKSIIKQNVIFENEKYGNGLDQLFDKCDFAIGSLGMHRINLPSGSTLKTKEYLSRGIPFIIGYEELSIPQELGFYYKVAGDESAIDIKSVLEFAKNCNKTDQMREFASMNLSWESQFKKIFNYVEEVHNGIYAEKN